MVLVKMESWSKHTPPWTRFGLLAIIAIAFITGNNATFVDEFFDTEPEVKELVDAEKGITYKGLSGEINLEHPSRRTKRSFYNKGRAWMFLNIPYAEPLNSTTVFQPSLYLTDKRFNETMAKRHKDEINIRRFGNFCPQSESDLTGLYKKYCYSEMAIDCLNLNVFSPVLDPPSNDTFPVYVLLHGGKLSQGSSCDFGRHGVIQNFVLQKVVVVTVNYRLGIYGYLRTTENEKEKTDSNRGLSDQIEALYWVNKHIHIFNGDNERVTLGGFEAGACSAALIAISEAKSALFNNVILHGSSLENCANGSVLVQENPKIEYSMEVIANDIALHNNLTEKFPLGMQMSSAKYVGNKDYHVPIEDKARSNSAANHKSKQLLTINRQDAHTQKPLNVIVGINHDELVALDNKINYAVSNQNELRAFFSKYLNLPNKWLNEALDEVFKAYKGKDDETTAMKILMDYVFTSNIFAMAELMVGIKHNVFIYRFSHVPDPRIFPDTEIPPGTVPHGSDFRYAYLPLHYWQTIHDADDTTLFEAEQNVSQHLSNILLSLIMGNLSSFAVPCYSGEIRNGTFLEISGSQSTKLNVSDNLLTKEKYDAWTRFYGKKNFPPAEDIFPFMIETTLNNNDTKIELFWNINWQKRRVDFKFQLTGNTELHFLVGFSDHGKYENSDGCYYSQTSSGDGNMKDYWVDNDLTLRVDLHQDCIFHKEKTNETEGLFYFSRKFLTCDPRDYNIEEGTTNILFAIGPKQIKNLNDSGVSYQMKYTQLLQEPVDIPPPTETNISYVDLRAPNITIPKQRTTYWCLRLDLNESIESWPAKHHIIKYEPIIQPGMENILHHMVVYHCSEPVPPFSNYCQDTHKLPPEMRTCSKVIAAWSMGAGAVTYPPQAGMPIGGDGFVPHLMIEIHYDNYALLDGLKDDSGIRITYTQSLREYDAGIIELGLIYSDANSIPPQQPYFPIQAHCPSECTEKLPREGINIFATQLHAHLTGRKLFTSHFRDGVKIGEINRDNHYSSHWQHIQPLAKHIRVLPGDVLTTTCVYETMDLKNWTWGGYGIEDEMCVNYIHFYPAAQVEVCKSAISNTTLDSFFKEMGVYKNGSGIHEMYSRWIPSADTSKWSDSEKVKILAEYYHVSPLNVACLDGTGNLLKPPPKKRWEHLDRPETFDGIYNENSRSSDECFATND